MAEYFEIYGTHIPISQIKDFRVIDVEFVFRPVYQEAKKSMLNALSNKKFEFVQMQPFAAIIGQQGHKSELVEYKAKDFKEALGKDISGAVIYTIADKLKLKAFKHQKYHCINLAGRAFTTYLDDIPASVAWNDGRIAEVYKEDPLYASLGGIAMPGIQYVPALIIKANDTFCFYGNGIQLADAEFEYERLKVELDEYRSGQTKGLKFGKTEKLGLPQMPKLRLPTKQTELKKTEAIESVVEQQNK